MKCQKCGENNVNVWIEKNINGRVSKQYLCSQCANKMDLDINFDMHSDIFDNMFDRLFNFSFPNYSRLLKGKNQNYENEESNYNTFNSKRYIKLNKNLNKQSCEQKDKGTNNISNLEEKLQLAIKEERYEDAAKLRDEIKKIKE